MDEYKRLLGYSRKIFTTGLLFLLVIAPMASAQEEEEQFLTPDDIEQIQVVGKKPLLYFHRQMMKTELNFYDSINDLLENPEHKIKCRREERMGNSGTSARLKTMYCLPNYVRSRLAEETQAAIQTGKPAPRIEDVEILVKDQQQEAMAAVTKLVESNPELLDKLLTMHNAKAEYEQKRLEAGFDN